MDFSVKITYKGPEDENHWITYTGDFFIALACV